MAWLINRMLSIPVEETLAERRGFHARDASVRQRIELVGQTFLWGYHAALRHEGAALARSLHSVGDETEGFAFEGAAMALTLLDHLLPGGGRFDRFVDGEGAPHVYMLYVGAGWALARLPWLRWRSGAFLERLDPLLRWLALDGYGFHQGYFYWPRFVSRQERARGLSGYAQRAFDQGLGRSLWFVNGGDVARIPATIAEFAKSRRADLWSGVGLACTYAGGRQEHEIEILRDAAGPYGLHLAQGAAFAAGARQRAGNPADHTEIACQVLCGLSQAGAAAVTDAARWGLPPDGADPAYEIWRRSIRRSIGKILNADATVCATGSVLS